MSLNQLLGRSIASVNILFNFLKDRVICSPGWPWTCCVSQGWLELLILFAFTSQVLELRACAVMPSLCGAGNRTWDFTRARREHYQYPKMLRLNMASSIQPRFCVCIRGLGCCLVVEHLWNTLGLIPRTENVCVCVVCFAGLCPSVLRSESIGFYKSRCHSHNVTMSLVLSQNPCIFF